MIGYENRLENERARIAKDLHDNLGASLTEISLKSDVAINNWLPDYDSRQYTREIGACAPELVQRLDEIVQAVNPLNAVWVSDTQGSETRGVVALTFSGEAYESAVDNDGPQTLNLTSNRNDLK